MAQFNGRLLTLLLVTGADFLPLQVVHQRQVDHPRKRALIELDRGTYVHHGDVIEENIAVAGAVVSHQNTSTACRCRSTNSPMTASSSPNSRASARKSPCASGSTATNRPPLVCGSQSNSFCGSLNVETRSP